VGVSQEHPDRASRHSVSHLQHPLRYHGLTPYYGRSAVRQLLTGCLTRHDETRRDPTILDDKLMMTLRLVISRVVYGTSSIV